MKEAANWGWFMDSETFTAPTLEEAKKMMARWLSLHRVIIKKEYAPLVVRDSVSIRIHFEDSY
jgi:hypothetical protein